MKNICKIIYTFILILLFLPLFFFEQTSSALETTKTNKSTSKKTTKKNSQTNDKAQSLKKDF
jgi:hypothetical protein